MDGIEMENMVLVTNDGKAHSLLGFNDFLDLIETYLGLECRNALDDYVTFLRDSLEDQLNAVDNNSDDF